MATVTATPAEDDAVELAVAGDDLGLLIGPKGATLQAVQELSRSVLQRTLPGESHARIRVDVGGYRARRREALEAFVTQGRRGRASPAASQKALEPMAPPDRKVVHDTVNDIAGVHTVSEGEDDPASGRHHPRLSCAHAPGVASLRVPSACLSATGGAGSPRGDWLRPVATDLRRHPGCSSSSSGPALGFLGPGPVEPHIDHAAVFLARCEESRARWWTSAAAAASPGLVAGRRPAGPPPGARRRRAKRCRFLEAAVSPRRRCRGARGPGRGPRPHGPPGVRPTRWWPAASGCPRRPRSAGARCCGWADGSSSASRLRHRSRTGGRPTGSRRLGLEAAGGWSTATAVQVLEQRTPCPDATPGGTALPANQPALLSDRRCSTWNTAAAKCGSGVESFT